MNDGCFIIDQPPRPSHDNPNHDADVNCITGFPSNDDATFAAAQRVCDAHNAAISHSAVPASAASEDERTSFEATVGAGRNPARGPNGDYVSAYVQNDWEVWQERAALTQPTTVQPFQARVQPWLMECFGEMIAGDREERNHRFIEEALELVQACGCTASEAHQLVDYVFARPVGEKAQEVGGVMVTLAALCLAQDLDMAAAGETELARIWTKVEQIRAKQAAKPKHSPLPVAPEPDDTSLETGEGDAR